MGRWGQLIVVIAFIVIPLASKVLQSIIEQYKANQERKRREQSTGRSDSSALIDRREDERQEKQLEARRRDEARRAELARRRQAQLEAWKARKAGGNSPPPTLQTRVSTPLPPAVANDLLSSQSGGELIASMLAQRVEQAQRIQKARQSTTQRAKQTHSRSRSASNTKQSSKQRHIHDPNDNVVHRLVLSDEEKRSWARTQSGLSPVELNANTGTTPPPASSNIQSIMHSPDALRNAFILKELLDPPLALRD